jgi:hypothetical protein
MERPLHGQMYAGEPAVHAREHVPALRMPPLTSQEAAQADRGTKLERSGVLMACDVDGTACKRPGAQRDRFAAAHEAPLHCVEHEGREVDRRGGRLRVLLKTRHGGPVGEALTGARVPVTPGAITVPTVTCARPSRAAPRAAQPRSEHARRRGRSVLSCRASPRRQEPAGVGAIARRFPTDDVGSQASYSTPAKLDGGHRTP